MDKKFEFDEPGLLLTHVMGVPGKRTFFLIMGERERWLRVWIEKYLLEALALAIEEFEFRLSKERPSPRRGGVKEPASESAPSKMPAAELEVDQISLDFDDGKAALNLLVHSVGPQRTDGIELICRVSLAQLKLFAAQAQAVCAAGRPRCSLCGGPIDPSGHTCPSIN